MERVKTLRKSNDDLPEKNGRQRLIAIAQTLFTQRGTSNVGINDVIRGAGVARMTLYNNFASKDALILAVYTELIETTLAELQQVPITAASEEDRVLRVFDHFACAGDKGDHRGCPFIHAGLQAAEARGPVYRLVQSYKQALRDYLLGLLDEDRENRAELADQLLILLDGGVIEGYLQGVARPARSARRAATTLLRSKVLADDKSSCG